MGTTLTLDDAVTVLPGVGAIRAAQLSTIGIETIGDLLLTIPFRYIPVIHEPPLHTLQVGDVITFRAKVSSKTLIKTKRGVPMIKARVSNETGALDLTWFHNRYVLSSLLIGNSYTFTGSVANFAGSSTIINPSVRQQPTAASPRIPVYHETAEVSGQLLARLVALAIENTTILDTATVQERCRRVGLQDASTALRILHQVGIPEHLFASIDDEIAKARRRLEFDEMYAILCEVARRKEEHRRSVVRAKAKIDDQTINDFLSFLPYAPTPSQRSAMEAIATDLSREYPMQRLLQGEVGSGKTTVAAFALWVAALSGQRGVLVAPTKILASQHAKTLQSLFAVAVHNRPGIFRPSIGLYTGKEKELTATILVGTHALFTPTLLDVPAVVVIDEEHRFGVKQREYFFQSPTKPHFLSMTATPIPRTVALTALADRDVSTIEPHRKIDMIKTWVTPPSKRSAANEWIKKTLKETGGQALIVCPFIDVSTVETLSSVKSATKEFHDLVKVFRGFRLGLLHGRMAAEEKEALFSKMLSQELDILVTTPVVEVGVDLPQANIIVIEGAERYGLASLHQLRGRVGRRGQEAFCLLFPSESDQQDAVGPRLQFFAQTFDGRALAEHDLLHRGSGQILGHLQHGLSSLRFASWSDSALIADCRAELVHEKKERPTVGAS